MHVAFKNIQNIVNVSIISVILMLPLIFLPITREFVSISKTFIFIIIIHILFILSFVSFIVKMRLSLPKNHLFNGVLLFIVGIALSVALMSTNKSMALTDQNAGLFIFLSLSIFLVFLSFRSKSILKSILFYNLVSGSIVAFVTLVLFFQPFNNIELPLVISFLKNPFFNPIGSQFDLIYYLGFTIVCFFGLASIVKYENTKSTTPVSSLKFKANKTSSISYVLFAIIVIGFSLQLYQVVRVAFFTSEGIMVPPLSTSWIAAIESLKNLFTAFFGVGIGNFPSVFTQAKDISYNVTDVWQIGSFEISRTALLHIFTEAGLLSVLGLIFIYVYILQNLKKVSFATMLVIFYGLFGLLFFPPSFFLFYIIFLTFGFFLIDFKQDENVLIIDISKFLPIYIILIIITGIIVIVSLYININHFIAEVHYRRAIDAGTVGNGQELILNQERAIQTNLNNPIFRKGYAETNLLLLSNIISQIESEEEITEEERLAIEGFGLQAINQAQAAIVMNEGIADNWYFLANIYRNLIPIDQNAILSAVQAYRQAIVLDPQNPTYRLELGGLYYLVEEYEESQRLFEESVLLKRDWPNARYNLAWAYNQQGNFRGAVEHMEIVTRLLDPVNQEEDLKRAQEDLQVFREALDKQVSEQESQQGQQQQTETNDLNQQDELDVDGELSLPEQQASVEADINIIDQETSIDPLLDEQETDVQDEDLEESNQDSSLNINP